MSQLEIDNPSLLDTQQKSDARGHMEVFLWRRGRFCFVSEFAEGKQLQETARGSRNVRGSGIAVDVAGGGMCYHKITGIAESP